jgi:hypothetical protein
MKELRFRLLTLIKNYTLLEMPMPFSLIAESFPLKSYKNVSMQLSWLKNHDLIGAKGSKYRYLYFITPKGIEYLSFLEAKKRKAQAILESDIEMELIKTKSFM